MRSNRILKFMLLAAAFMLAPPAIDSSDDPGEKSLARSAERMIRTSETTLAPIYAPLARQIAKDLDLEKREGVGIDLGSGPGNLILELCERTRLQWINADINPHFFAHFYERAAEKGVAHRVGAIQADAGSLPFRDGYADVVVSRGSYPFWSDRAAGFREVLRVLKPGGVAYIGRGFARDMPVKTARAIRSKQGDNIQYDVQAHAKSLESIVTSLGVTDYRIDIPKPPEEKTIHYGVWVRFRKPVE